MEFGLINGARVENRADTKWPADLRNTKWFQTAVVFVIGFFVSLLICVAIGGITVYMVRRGYTNEYESMKVEGKWSNWNNGSCSVSCGVGMKFRMRHCSNPYPSNGGKYCQGKAMEQIECILESCPTTEPKPKGISFYAYMTSDKTNIPQHQTLIYDAVTTNDGNGYDSKTGIFTVPLSGHYVFAWSMTVWVRSAYETHLMVNSDVKGVAFADAGEATDADMSTGVIVLKVQKGDTVYVRTGPYVRAKMQSSKHGRVSFSGWIIY